MKFCEQNESSDCCRFKPMDFQENRVNSPRDSFESTPLGSSAELDVMRLMNVYS